MIKENTVIFGDCLNLMPQIPSKSVDMVLCDLPYGITQNSWDSVVPLELLWQEYERVVKDNGVVVLTANQPFTSFLITSNIKLFKYSLVWEKSLKTNFLNVKKQPLRSHEDIVVFYKNQCTYNPQGLVKGKISGGNKLTSSYGHWKSNSNNQIYTNYPNSIIKIANPNHGNVHPTQKPVELFEYLVRTYTNIGDLVLDNCIGSGTTAIACLNTSRKFIGIDSNEKYVKLVLNRIKAAQNTKLAC